MTLTCTIIDDDPLNVDMIEYYINKTEGIQLINKTGRALDVAKIINTARPHIIFIDIDIIDIENQKLNDLFQKDIVYVFVTRYPQGYVKDILPDGFLNSGYLFKPVSFTLFTEEIKRIKNIYVPCV